MKSREQKFVDEALRRRMLGQLRTGFALGLAFFGLSATVGQFFYGGAWQRIVPPASAIAFGTALVACLAVKRAPALLIALMLVCDLGFLAACAVANFFNRTTPGIPLEVIASGDAYYLLISTIMVIVCVVDFKNSLARAIAFAAFAGPSLLYPTGILIVDFWNWALPGFMTAALAVRWQLHALAIVAAKSEFQRLSAFIPRSIFDRSVETGVDVANIFAAETRFCVCLCSDWRSYQALTATMEPKAVVNALEIYYSAAYELLQQAFPQGNYFSDWIADELFVVAFAEPGMSESEVAHGAIAFARALLQRRVEIAKVIGVPKAIDVGIAAGLASVGIMGPPGGRKATALGEIPGRSRRLQTSAKSLRQQTGDCDRIVIGNEVVSLCGTIEGLRTVAIDGDRLRDLADETLHYLERLDD